MTASPASPDDTAALVETVIKTARALRETMDEDRIRIAREARKLVNGSGAPWWFTHARIINFVNALAALDQAKEKQE